MCKVDGVLPGGEGSAVIVVALFRHRPTLENVSNGGEPGGSELDYVVSCPDPMHTFLYHGTEPVSAYIRLTPEVAAKQSIYGISPGLKPFTSSY